MLGRISSMDGSTARLRRGAVAIQVALMLTAIVGVSALGTEITFLLYKHRQMQSAADSAALGAATPSSADILRAKQERARKAIPSNAPHQPFFGLTLVSCEQGDIRQSPQGLYMYADGERSEIALPTHRSPRDLVVSEFHDAVRGIAPALHDGRWGLANLEVCAAAIESSAHGREVRLQHQVAVPAGAETSLDANAPLPSR